MAAPYKILSLDGGGTWALLQVLTLQHLFEIKYPDREVRGHEVLRHFDLVIANSGGSMVLAALCCNWTFSNTIAIFEDKDKRSQIFSKLSKSERYFPVNLLHSLGITSIGSRYSTTRKVAALRDILRIENDEGKVMCRLDSVTLPDLPELIGKTSLQLIVTTFDIINRRAKLFRSFRDSKSRAEQVAGLDHFDEINLVKAIHGSSNAPVNYFDFPAIFSPSGSDRRFYLWDGALGGFNNPIMAGVTEALANGVKRTDLRVLSIGTASKLVSDAYTRKFRDQYYSTLLGRKLKKKKGSDKIDFVKTKETRKFLGLFNLPFQKNRWFKGAGYFMGVVKNMTQSILFEPQSWATYSAYVSLFSEDIDNPINDKHFIRLSPQIITTGDDNHLNDKLYKLDMDLTKQEDIQLLRSCFSAWKEGVIINEPVQWVKTIHKEYVFARGHSSFGAAVKSLEWL